MKNTNKVLIRFFDLVKEVEFPVWDGTIDVTFQADELKQWYMVESIKPIMVYFPHSDSIIELSLDRFVIPDKTTDITLTISLGP